jgi:hypothetical protein
MAVGTQIRQYAAGRVVRKLARTIPWVGAVVAVATLGAAIRRKGWLGGSADTALDMIPWVGGMKNFAEVVRGRNFIRDKRIAG